MAKCSRGSDGGGVDLAAVVHVYSWRAERKHHRPSPPRRPHSYLHPLHPAQRPLPLAPSHWRQMLLQRERWQEDSGHQERIWRAHQTDHYPQRVRLEGLGEGADETGAAVRTLETALAKHICSVGPLSFEVQRHEK